VPAQTFNLTGSGTSAAIVIGAGEKLRVRFSSTTGSPAFTLAIVANGVTSLVPVGETDGWISLGVLSGDSVSLRMNGMRPTDTAVGVLESGT
jgi:hypothetical protein